MNIVKIISGGQTGADRAALDAAIACGIAHGGWSPRGRRAEDGPVAAIYQLSETRSFGYPVRTRLNVEAADLTLILTIGPLTGGSLLTLEFAKVLGKPCVHLDLAEISQNVKTGLRGAGAAACVRNKILQAFKEAGSGIPQEIVLNVAGPRASSNRKIYDAVYRVMIDLLH